MDNGSRAPLVVYTIVERERDGKKFWVRIGSAFRNRDGSLNAFLDAVPVNGTMHIREPRALPERDAPPHNDGDHAMASGFE